jgi:hypothetical protein
MPGFLQCMSDDVGELFTSAASSASSAPKNVKMPSFVTNGPLPDLDAPPPEKVDPTPPGLRPPKPEDKNAPKPPPSLLDDFFSMIRGPGPDTSGKSKDGPSTTPPPRQDYPGSTPGEKVLTTPGIPMTDDPSALKRLLPESIFNLVNFWTT